MTTTIRPAAATRAEVLRLRLADRLGPEADGWLDQRCESIASGAETIGEVFPAVARQVGRDPLDDAWTVDEAARATLVVAFAAGRPGGELVAELTNLYRYGDTAEKLAVLKSLGIDVLALGNDAAPLLADAIRTNDQRLLAAALGPYATEHLSDDQFRQAVLKCVFAGVPLELVDGLPRRTDDELIRMMADFAAERTAAGRDVPADIRPYLAQEES